MSYKRSELLRIRIISYIAELFKIEFSFNGFTPKSEAWDARHKKDHSFKGHDLGVDG